MLDLIPTLTLLALLGAGLMAGLFFTFSTFVMQALARLEPPKGLEAMQEINRTVMNPLTMGVFFGTALLALALAIAAAVNWGDPGSGWLLAGGLLYAVGGFGVTAAGNVPLNEWLAKIDPASDGAPAAWVRYLARWQRWNHLRTLAASLAVATLALALRAG